MQEYLPVDIEAGKAFDRTGVPDIEMWPMPLPVLVPRPATTSSSSRQTVPSKNSSGAPARRDFSSSVTSAQAAMK